MKHILDKDRFQAELENRGWSLSAFGGDWVAPMYMTRKRMEQDWIDAILASVHCPHEEAGVE